MTMTARTRHATLFAFGLAGIVGPQAGCAPPPRTALEQVVEARSLAARLLLGMARVAEASNRAVMSGSDEVSAAAANDARQTLTMVKRDAGSLGALLGSLRYSHEQDLLAEFNQRFDEYRKLDDTILSLAVQNTNLKAQRLSFGPSQDAARSFAATIESVRPGRPAETWQVRAQAATALAAVREIQVLQGPHIAEADAAAMTRLEGLMKEAESTARHALGELGGLTSAATAGEVTKASAALDRFMGLNAEIVRLSRANSNVQSLALSLGQTRRLLAACDESLQSLELALGSRRLGPSR
jgi:hypothetical protein